MIYLNEEHDIGGKDFMAGRARRYSGENKLNYKKIFAVIVLFVVIIMFVIGIKKLITTSTSSTGRITTINYFPVYSDGKWGIISSNGEIIIQPQYEEMPVIPNNLQTIFICTYDVDYDKGTYKTKVVNEKNEDIITGYDSIRFIDTINKESELNFATNTLIVEKDEKYGLIDLSGKQLLETSYDSIEILSEVENSLLITKDGKVGLCDYKGNVIIDTKYKQIKSIGKDYKNGYITVNDANLYGIIDFNKSVIFDNQYLDIKQIYSSNKYAVKIDENYRIVDRNGKLILEESFEDIKDINDENIVFGKNGKYGITTISLEKKVEEQYEDLIWMKANYYIAKKDGKYGIINTNNEVQINFNYFNIEYEGSSGIIIGKLNRNQSDIYDSNMNLKLNTDYIEMAEGYMKVKVGEQYKYYNFKFEEKVAKDVLSTNELFSDKKNGKYGFVDKDGNIKINHKYDEITEFNKYGYAGIKSNGLWGVINVKGEIVLEPTYNLDNIVDMDFIGKWHKGIGADYYTDI